MSIATFRYPSLEVGGPLLDIKVGMNPDLGEIASQFDDSPHPPIACVAQIDTGSRLTVVREELLAGLGLIPVGTIRISTPSHTAVVFPRYYVWIEIAGLLSTGLAVAAAPMRGYQFDALIGRDLLTRGLFVMNGPDGTITLGF